MKAVYIERFGGPAVLQYGDLPDPSVQPGQVVVDIHAASVNGADWKVRAGKASSVRRPCRGSLCPAPRRPWRSAKRATSAAS